MTKKKYEYEKGRDWTFIVYPESAPDNWRTVLDERFCCKVSKRSLVFQDDSYLSRDS
ncbi:Rep family protein [Enterococcus faecalis]|uniref:Rep family protein n=1 Tax=Enterococcus faecalis TaxID=1351 RepID=UPI003B7A0DC4